MHSSSGSIVIGCECFELPESWVVKRWLGKNQRYLSLYQLIVAFCQWRYTTYILFSDG